jgi:5'-methylthioadenosine phosphorylase
MNSSSARLGVVGGSGLYGMAGLEIHDEVRVETPYGDPSDAFLLGEIEGAPVAFLARHARGHHFTPSTVPYRANLYAFKLLGVRNLFSVSAVGSLRAEIEPMHLVVPDQFVDRTRGRVSTFAEPGAVLHVAMADPTCPTLGAALVEAAEAEGLVVHKGGTYLCIDGPQFSTRAESHLYRSWGMDLIGMTNATEAKLAREAGIAYATLAMACDYDCWHEGHADVTAEIAIANLMASVDNAQRVIRRAIGAVSAATPASCGDASRALISTPSTMQPDTRRRLSVLLDTLSHDDSKEPE